ncbi:unnamed protein product [Dibothriocephalus latus]|uniref:Uncharacterized protein n=1 Tax=Dibothriocephalus latus TaxID=60516 RepID=A0A3P7N075_DIBLA|nr:unnamed protein product [Dibothriocephalus latus]
MEGNVVTASLAAKLDEIMCGILCGVLGMSVSPEWRLNYFTLLSSAFRKMGYDAPIGLADISDDREPRKWLRMLSYYIEFIRTTTKIGDIASRVIDDTVQSADVAQAYANRISALRVVVEGQRTKTTEYREKINILTSEYSKASDNQKQVESHLASVKLKLESLNASAAKDSEDVRFCPLTTQDPQCRSRHLLTPEKQLFVSPVNLYLCAL